MSNNTNGGMVAMCRYTIRAAMFPVILALLISSGESYAGGIDTDTSVATRPTTVGKKPESGTQYVTPLSDYDNGGYFTNEQEDQPVTVAHKSKPAAHYETPLSDYENGGYFTDDKARQSATVVQKAKPEAHYEHGKYVAN